MEEKMRDEFGANHGQFYERLKEREQQPGAGGQKSEVGGSGGWAVE